MLARLFFSLAGPDEHLLLAFYLMDGDPVDHAFDSQWTTFKRVPGAQGRRSWLVGSTQDETTFAMISRLARNFAFGDPVIVVVAAATDFGEQLCACHWDIGLGDEALLLPFYRTVANDSYDPEEVRIVSTRFDCSAIVQHLKALGGVHVECSK